MKKTVLDIIRSTTEYLGRHGIEQPRLNSEHLVAHALQRKRIELYMEFDRPLDEADLAPLRELVRKRAGGEPLQHLLGTVEFHGRTFIADKRALIPRPETEQLVELILALPLPARPRIIDVGTGTGVIALTLAAELPEAEIVAVDLSAEALDLARQNADQLGLGGRITWIENNLLAGVEGPFDLIAANLPYIATGALSGLSKEVQHDPALALDGGPDGITLLSRLISEAKSRLRAGGRIALEIGHDQTETLRELLAAENYQDMEGKTDYQGIGRFLFATYG